MAKVFIGIDPGLSGYIVVLESKHDVWSADPFPVIHVVTSRKTKGRVPNIPGLYHLIKRVRVNFRGCQIVAGVERVGPMPGSSKAMFHFGGAYFSVQAVLSYATIPYELVEPKVWLKHFGLQKTNKEKSLLKAGQLFPAVDLSLKQHLDKAEGLLIARYVADMHEAAFQKAIVMNRREV